MGKFCYLLGDMLNADGMWSRLGGGCKDKMCLEEVQKVS